VMVTFDNGLLVTSQQVLDVTGGSASPRSDQRLAVRFRNVTVIAQRGFYRAAAPAATPYMISTTLTCDDCILGGAKVFPLIEQSGLGDIVAMQQLLSWRGRGNLYTIGELFWRVGSDTPPPQSITLTFDQWREYWGNSTMMPPTLPDLVWQELPATDRPLHTHTPADYVLSDPSSGGSHPARNLAEDGGDLGVRAERLPIVQPDIGDEAENQASSPAPTTTSYRRPSSPPLR